MSRQPSAIPIIESASADQVVPLFRRTFGEEPDRERLGRARVFAVGDTDPIPAAALVEQDRHEDWHLWLLAVDEGHRGHGFGRRLIRHVVARAATEGAASVRLKTFKKWGNMRNILQEDGWFLCGAEPAARFDGVREIWRRPIVRDPVDLLVVGANPRGRGGEWLERALALPGLFQVRAVADPQEAVRCHWRAKGIGAFSSMEQAADAGPLGAAVIAVPPVHAASVQRDCIRLSLPYLVEKPMVASLHELMELQRQLLDSGLGVVVGVQRRSHPAYVAMKAGLRDERVSDLSIRISLGRARTDVPDGHRADRGQCRGGALIDLGYHALDLAHFLLGNPLEPVSCSLFAGADLAAGIESAASILGRCGNTWVRLEVDRHGPGKREEVRARTGDGVWIADREGVRAPGGSTYYQCPGSWEKAELGTLAALAGFATAGGRPGIDLWEHLALFETVERAYSSARLLGLEGFAA